MALTEEIPAKARKAPSFKEVAAMALPQMGLMLCHLGISMTDLWVAGRIDSSVLASMGVVGQVFMLLMLVTSIAGSGALSAVSQALGAKLQLRARRYAGLILSLAFSAGSIVAVLGFLSLPLIFSLLRVPEQLLPVVRVFVVVYCLNLPFYYSLILLNSIFRAYKLVRLPFFTFLFVLVANFFGSTGFGLGWWGMPNYGYAGVVWSTFGSTIIGLVCSLLAVRRHGIIRRDSFAPWRWNIRAVPYLLKVGVPSAAGKLVEQGGRVMMIGFVTALPGAVDIMAGMTLGMRVHAVIMFPLGAIVLTMAIFSGHLLGARQEDTLFRFGLRAACWNAAIFACAAVVLYCFRDTAAELLAPGSEAVKHAVYFLSFTCFGVPAMAFGMTLHGVFSGTGATPLAFIADICPVWIVLVPLGYLLSQHFGWGEKGIFISMLCADFAFAAIMTALYCSRKWLLFGMRARKTAAA
ncbi:MAG: hypothetical protein DELT_00232 [Desulfovibrio sp.]